MAADIGSSEDAVRNRPKRHFRGYWNLENTKPWVDLFVHGRLSAVDIAKKVSADPGTVSKYLRQHGVEIYSGLHRVNREPPRLSAELAQLLCNGHEEVLKFLEDRVWGISASASGLKQLIKFCNFVRLPLTVGRNEAAANLGIDKSMVTEWTEGTKQPYLVRVANTMLQTTVRPGWKLLPLHIGSGGNRQGPWIQVPTRIQSYDDIPMVISQLTALDSTYKRAMCFGLAREILDEMRNDLSAYLLGMMGGDSSKGGGKQARATSMNLDLQLSRKQPTNERLGNFVCMCANSLGIAMDQKQDKEPSGSTRFGRQPTAAYRWISERSPLIAWMFNVGLGLQWGECTTLNCLQMQWIFGAPRSFRIRFIQGLADSDGTVKPSEVLITSVPNTEFVTKLLLSLDMTTAHVVMEEGHPLRTMVNRKQSATLPIFNEFVKSYRYEKMRQYRV